MASKSICTECLHTLRKSIRAGRNVQRSIQQHAPQQQYVRALSTRPPMLQQQPQSQRIDSRAPVPPMTTSTVTSSSTATAPSQPLQDQSPESFPSSKEMQRAINNRLSTGPAFTASLAQTLRRTATKTTETYITYGLTEALFKACSDQADYNIPEDQRSGLLSGKGPTKTAGGEDLGVYVDGRQEAWWFTELNLPPTFSTWSQVTYLHMYLLTVRLRALESPESFQNYQRYLLEHFSHAAEDKMIIMHNMAARGTRNKYLKDLFLQWRGLLAAYDEGMVNGDAALAGAVWRNLWKGDEDVDWTKVASVVAWMRSVVGVLGKLEVQDLVGNLDGKQGLFESGRGEARKVLAYKSQGLLERLE